VIDGVLSFVGGPSLEVGTAYEGVVAGLQDEVDGLPGLEKEWRDLDGGDGFLEAMEVAGGRRRTVAVDQAPAGVRRRAGL
jgi:hypothetical protein